MRLVQFIILAFILFPSLSLGTNLRGRIEASHAYASAPFPAHGVQVELFRLTQKGAVSAGSYITSNDGMYYFQNIPPGSYSIIVNNYLEFQLSIRNSSYQDVPPILLRY